MTEKPQNREPLQLSRIRGELDHLAGKQYWRSLEELAQTEEFTTFLHREFPENASEWTDPVGRRNFLRLMGASLALAGVGACTKQPAEEIVPYVRQPEELVPGRPLFYASAMPQGGTGHPVLVESHMGRPTKIEGNKEHPASNGATNAIAQASILSLYDPDRSQVPLRTGKLSNWDRFVEELNAELALHQTGQGVRILTGSITSPTEGALIEAIRGRFPDLAWHQWEADNRDNVREGARLAFGRYLDVHYDLSQTRVILSLGADFLTTEPGSVRYARDFAQGRRVRQQTGGMNRLYVVETTPTPTGTMADHRLALNGESILRMTEHLAASLGVGPAATGSFDRQGWLDAAAADLRSQGGQSLVIAGPDQPTEVHATVHRINQALGSIGKCVRVTEPIEVEPVNQTESLRALCQDAEAGQVRTLLILGGNPVYTAPADLNLSEVLANIRFRAHLSAYVDETSSLCHWHLPQTNFLEAWSDIRAYDGTVTIAQPLIAPLYSSRTTAEILATLAGQSGPTSYQLVRRHWQQASDAGDFEKQWRRWIHDGFVDSSAAPMVEAQASAFTGRVTRASESGLELFLQADPSIGDGTHSNNGWLQELPKPLTKLTWDNAAMIAPATADRLGIATGDWLELSVDNQTVTAPAWILPGQAVDSVTVHLGFGRTHAGRVGNGVGFDAYPLRTSSRLWRRGGLQIQRAGAGYKFASTQGHHLIEMEASEQAEMRHLVREATLSDFLSHPEMIHEMAHEPDESLTLFPRHEYNGYAWGMSIDLSSCTGCNACVVACQSENNIPVVGKDQVLAGREMHWIRVDRYFKGTVDDPKYVHQPMLCHHCENAPCEVVCPVAATTHSEEGLNEMTYNRCVGTRYCSNNCPYKVRRFNFFLYQDWDTPSLQLMRNPDVTVRSRGVMEKCTYCVQRINRARITAKNERRKIVDGDIETACQAVCPSQAIVFGDINDTDSHVTRLKGDNLNYGILGDLNTRPRTTYLARLRNPNPEIVDE